MRFGLTGNPAKDDLWAPLARLVAHLQGDGCDFVIDPRLADGLAERGLASGLDAHVDDPATAPPGRRPDVVLSFGGDGTLLRTAHALGRAELPILGVNVGRLGFLADVETRELDAVLDRLQRGAFAVEQRSVLEVTAVEATPAPDASPIVPWALNEVALERAGRAGLLAIRVHVDGAFLNTYWGDGLIVATPTGSTAYSLSVGGPILAPDAGVVVLSPVAPHTLTVRPIVLSDAVTLDLTVRTRDAFVVAADGTPTLLSGEARLRIARAAHRVHLVKLTDRSFFGTLRSKLLWGHGAKEG